MALIETLKRLLEAKEWNLVCPKVGTIGLEDFELEEKFGKIIFTFFDGNSFQNWHLEAFDLEDGKILLKVSKKFGKEKAVLTLVSRKTRHFTETRVLEIAKSFAEKTNMQICRIKQHPKRIAQIFLENRKEKQILLVGFDERVERLLSRAILEKQKRRIRQVSIAVLNQAEKLRVLHSLLRDYWKNSISIYRVSSELQIEEFSHSQDAELKISFAAVKSKSRLIRKIVALDEERIEVLPLKNEKLLCFLGLPFASVKAGKIWFGIGREKRLLTQENFIELCKLVETLKEYRCFNSPNKRHEFYCLMPEKWLESVLRKNIKLLDPELVLSPVYEQLSLDKEKVDLLAIRKDGRLVVVELKTSESRELLFQALGYWWKIDYARKVGLLQKAKIFPGLEIQEKQPMIYLVSPALNFHKDLDLLASTINPNIEIFRFGLNQDWRREVRVVEKRKI
jgi:hypothetical protein